MTIIDEYIKKVDKDKRAELRRIRNLGKEIVPDAEETIGYAMPTLKYNGKPFLGFDAHKHHIGIYPYSGATIEKLKPKLKDYSLSSGAIRVPLGWPISKELLELIIKTRLKELK